MQFNIGSFRHRKYIAAFDFDFTLVKPIGNGRTFSNNVQDWEWINHNVVDVIQDLYKKKFCIMIFTNQSKKWKIDQIKTVAELFKVPVKVVIAFDKYLYKPNPKIFQDNVTKFWDNKKSFFVGDALGRNSDWSNSDKLFADSIGINVISPEHMFNFNKFDNTRDSTTFSCICPENKQEIIIMVGYPGSGKTTLAKQVFSNYKIISGDKYKNSAKMIAIARKFLDSGFSVVFDATNPSIEKRAQYIHLANEYKLTSRCVHLDTSLDLSLARNNLRSRGVPRIVYNIYNKNFVHPHVSEGCSVVIVNNLKEKFDPI